MQSIAVELTELSENASAEQVYILKPKSTDDAFYSERTDRNIGWITKEEQAYLRGLTVGIAGCGGMGGLVAQILLRAGIGTIKIADTETFDVSNINRQFGAMRTTIGQSKALATARLMRNITDDTTIYVYPKGITPEYVDHFLEGCDLVLDEIEYWALAGRILLHKKAREMGIDIINANTVGFGTRLFLFTSRSATIEQCFGVTYEYAEEFEVRNANKQVSHDERIKVMTSVSLGLIPEFTSYLPAYADCSNLKAVAKRLATEGRAPIIATNPPMASGFLADHAMLHMLQKYTVKRQIVVLPEAPGYLYFDAAKMKAKVRKASKIRFLTHRFKVLFLAKMAAKHAKP